MRSAEENTEKLMAYTRRQKELLIKKFKKISDEKLKILQQKSDEYCRQCEKKINRKINSVNVTLWNVKIKHILQVERLKQPTIRTLVKDVKELK